MTTPPDSSRCILHLDIDAFYAQVEEIRNPRLRHVPLGITQKYLVVTCNYLARAAGVTKLMATAEAKTKCPNLVLVSGEDLTPYRDASKAIFTVLQRYGPAERLGMDEVWVDVTQEVKRRIVNGTYDASSGFCGHVHVAGTDLRADSRYRPQDLRVSVAGVQSNASSSIGNSSDVNGNGSPPADSLLQVAAGLGMHPHGVANYMAAAPVDLEGMPSAAVDNSVAAVPSTGLVPCSIDKDKPWHLLLLIGSAVAQEARAAVRQEAGFRSSAGIACSKALAKLCGGLHKPNDQTVLLPSEAAAFIAPLPLRALPGVGRKVEQQLRDAFPGVQTVGQLRDVTYAQLLAAMGERLGVMLYGMCRGRDTTPVKVHAAPKSMTVEDSFRGCSSMQAVKQVLQVLAPDLLTRLHEDALEHHRRPGSLTLKWRVKPSYERAAATCQWPLPSFLQQPTQEQVALLVHTAMGMLQRALVQPFCLTLLNVGAANFKSYGQQDAAGTGSTGSIATFLTRHRAAAAPVGSERRSATAAATSAIAATFGGSAVHGSGSHPAGRKKGVCRWGEGPNGSGAPFSDSSTSSSDGGGGSRRDQSGRLLAHQHDLPALPPGSAAGEVGHLLAAQQHVWRRDYDGSHACAPAVVISKRQERMLVESFSTNAVVAAAGLAGGAAAAAPPRGRSSQLGPKAPPNHPQQPAAVSRQTARQTSTKGLNIIMKDSCYGMQQQEQQLPANLQHSRALAPARHPQNQSTVDSSLDASATDTTTPSSCPIAPAGTVLITATVSEPGTAQRTTPCRDLTAAITSSLQPEWRMPLTAAPTLALALGRAHTPTSSSSRVHPSPACTSTTLAAATAHTHTTEAHATEAHAADAVTPFGHTGAPCQAPADTTTPVFGMPRRHHSCGDGNGGAGSTPAFALDPCNDDLALSMGFEFVEGYGEEDECEHEEAVEGNGCRAAAANSGAVGGCDGSQQRGHVQALHTWQQQPTEQQLLPEVPHPAQASAVALCASCLGDSSVNEGASTLFVPRGESLAARSCTCLAAGPAGSVQMMSASAPMATPLATPLELSTPCPVPATTPAPAANTKPMAASMARVKAASSELARMSPRVVLQALASGARDYASVTKPAAPAPAPAGLAKEVRAPPGMSVAPAIHAADGMPVATDCAATVPAGGPVSALAAAPTPVNTKAAPGLRRAQSADLSVSRDGARLSAGSRVGTITALARLLALPGHAAKAAAVASPPAPASTPPTPVHLSTSTPPSQVHPLECHQQRVIIYVDIDCYCCQIERLDEPRLASVPLAVRQSDGGGFVSVSCEAQAPGIRCGDGTGASGREAVPHLRAMGEVSEAEAMQRCPGLHVRDMRMDRYQQVAGQIHLLLRRFAPDGQVERASYDDFYLDVTSACVTGSDDDGDKLFGSPTEDAMQAAPGAKVAAEGRWEQVEPALQHGIVLASRLRAAMLQELSIMVSCCVAGTKQLARLVGPMSKPNGLTVLPYCLSLHFLCSQDIKSIPHLTQKLSSEVVSELGVSTVGQLVPFTQLELAQCFGQTWGAFLWGLPRGVAGASDVTERGAQKSITVERSFQALTRFTAAKEVMQELVGQLWPRLVDDASQHHRVPSKLSLTVHQAYGRPSMRSGDMPTAIQTAIHSAAAAMLSAAPTVCGTALQAAVLAADKCTLPSQLPSSDGKAAASSHDPIGTLGVTPVGAGGAGTSLPVSGSAVTGCRALLEGFEALFRATTASTSRVGMQVTRLRLTACYNAQEAVDQQQKSISMFLHSPCRGVPSKTLPPETQRASCVVKGRRGIRGTAKPPADGLTIDDDGPPASNYTFAHSNGGSNDHQQQSTSLPTALLNSATASPTQHQQPVALPVSAGTSNCGGDADCYSSHCIPAIGAASLMLPPLTCAKGVALYGRISSAHKRLLYGGLGPRPEPRTGLGVSLGQDGGHGTGAKNTVGVQHPSQCLPAEAFPAASVAAAAAAVQAASVCRGAAAVSLATGAQRTNPQVSSSVAQCSSLHADDQASGVPHSVGLLDHATTGPSRAPATWPTGTLCAAFDEEDLTCLLHDGMPQQPGDAGGATTNRQHLPHLHLPLGKKKATVQQTASWPLPVAAGVEAAPGLQEPVPPALSGMQHPAVGSIRVVDASPDAPDNYAAANTLCKAAPAPAARIEPIVAELQELHRVCASGMGPRGAATSTTAGATCITDCRFGRVLAPGPGSKGLGESDYDMAMRMQREELRGGGIGGWAGVRGPDAVLRQGRGRSGSQGQGRSSADIVSGRGGRGKRKAGVPGASTSANGATGKRLRTATLEHFWAKQDPS